MRQGAQLTPHEEHAFWLEILGDHAIFVRDFLSAEEQQWVRMAESYITAFRGLRQQLQGLDPQLPASSPEMTAFARQAYPVAMGYYQMEGRLQDLRLHNEVNIHLTATYFNGTLSENGEYLRLLRFYLRGEEPEQLTFLQLLDMWLMDQVGHSLLLRNMLDPMEYQLEARAEAFIRTFASYMSKRDAFEKYARFARPNSPIFRRFGREVLQSVLELNAFVRQVVEMYRHDELVNRATLRFLEHHFPETCYFIRKLSAFVPEAAPHADCSLAKPSFLNP